MGGRAKRHGMHAPLYFSYQLVKFAAWWPPAKRRVFPVGGNLFFFSELQSWKRPRQSCNYKLEEEDSTQCANLDKYFVNFDCCQLEAKADEVRATSTSKQKCLTLSPAFCLSLRGPFIFSLLPPFRPHFTESSWKLKVSGIRWCWSGEPLSTWLSGGF